MTTPTKPRSRVTLTERCEAASLDVANRIHLYLGRNCDVEIGSLAHEDIRRTIENAILAAIRRELGATDAGAALLRRLAEAEAAAADFQKLHESGELAARRERSRADDMRDERDALLTAHRAEVERLRAERDAQIASRDALGRAHATVTRERDEARAQLAERTAERDAARAKLATLDAAIRKHFDWADDFGTSLVEEMVHRAMATLNNVRTKRDEEKARADRVHECGALVEPHVFGSPGCEYHDHHCEECHRRGNCTLASCREDVSHIHTPHGPTRRPPDGTEPPTVMLDADLIAALCDDAPDDLVCDAESVLATEREAGRPTIVRNESTPEAREWWASAGRSAAEVEQWPAWKRAWINVAQEREAGRVVGDSEFWAAVRAAKPTKIMPDERAREAMDRIRERRAKACPQPELLSEVTRLLGMLRAWYGGTETEKAIDATLARLPQLVAEAEERADARAHPLIAAALRDALGCTCECRLCTEGSHVLCSRCRGQNRRELEAEALGRREERADVVARLRWYQSRDGWPKEQPGWIASAIERGEAEGAARRGGSTQ